MSNDQVPRYELDETFGEHSMMQDDSGDYVKHDDYAKLESLCDDYERLCQKKDAELAALKEQLAAARNDALEEAAELCGNYGTTQGTYFYDAIRALASQPAAPAQPDTLTEDEEIALLCKIEDYMSITERFSQTHPDSVKVEDELYTLVNSLIVERRAAPPVQQPDDVRKATSAVTLTKHQIHDIAKDASERTARNACTAPELCYAPIRSAIEDALADITKAEPISAESLAEIMRESAENPVPVLTEQEMTDICTARGWSSGAAPAFRDIALVFWVNGALAERQALATPRPGAALTEEADTALATLVNIADFMHDNSNIHQTPDEYGYASQFDYELDHASAELVSIATKLRAILAASGGALAVPEWIGVDERLPENSMPRIAVYVNSYGNSRRIRAMYVKQFEMEANGDECDSETRESDDTEWLKAGWYECIDNWGDYSSVTVTEGVISHWMDIPAAPAIPAQGQTK